MFMGMLGLAFIVGRDADDGLRGGGETGSTIGDAIDGDGKGMVDGIDAASDLSMRDATAPTKDPYRRWCRSVLFVDRSVASKSNADSRGGVSGGDCATRMGTVRERG